MTKLAPIKKHKVLSPWHVDRLKTKSLWDLNVEGQRQVVTIVDTCIDFTRPSLLNKNLTYIDCSTQSFSNNIKLDNHGTAVAGIISGEKDMILNCSHISIIDKICYRHPQLLLSGIMPKTKIIHYPVEGGITCEDASQALNVSFTLLPNIELAFPAKYHGRANITIINLSGGNQYNKNVYDFNSAGQQWRNLIKNGYSCDELPTDYLSGVVFVAAIGNEGKNISLEINKEYRMYPAAMTKPRSDPKIELISVGGLDFYADREDPKIWTGSNYGPKYCDVLAPATMLNLLLKDSDKAWVNNGTSLAAPIVSAALVAIKSCKPHASAPELKEALLETSDSYRPLLGYVKGGKVVNLENIAKQYCEHYEQDITPSIGSNKPVGADSTSSFTSDEL